MPRVCCLTELHRLILEAGNPLPAVHLVRSGRRLVVVLVEMVGRVESPSCSAVARLLDDPDGHEAQTFLRSSRPSLRSTCILAYIALAGGSSRSYSPDAQDFGHTASSIFSSSPQLSVRGFHSLTI